MPQPASRSSRLPPCTSRSIEKTNSDMYGEVPPLLVLAVHVADRVGDDQRRRRPATISIIITLSGSTSSERPKWYGPGREPRPRGRRRGCARSRAGRASFDEGDERGDERAEGRRRSRGSPRARRESAVPASVIATAEASGSSRQIQAAAAIVILGAS